MGRTVKVHESTHERLQELKPYDSMSFNELIDEMADVYTETRRDSREAAP